MPFISFAQQRTLLFPVDTLGDGVGDTLHGVGETPANECRQFVGQAGEPQIQILYVFADVVRDFAFEFVHPLVPRLGILPALLCERRYQLLQRLIFSAKFVSARWAFGASKWRLEGALFGAPEWREGFRSMRPRLGAGGDGVDGVPIAM